MPDFTPEEMLIECKKTLRPDYGTAYHYCRQFLCEASECWDFHETLFGNKKRIELLNATSPLFWYRIQSILFNNTVLKLCTLTEQSGGPGHRRLSIKYLSKFEKNAEFQKLVNTASKSTEWCTPLRNNRLVHNNLYDIYKDNTSYGGTRLKITTAIRDVFAVLRWVSLNRMNTDTILPSLGDKHTDRLLEVLYSGHSAINSATNLPNDLAKYPQPPSYPDWLFSNNHPFERYRDP